MFKFEELKQLHLEISNNCQASCPMCERNIRGGLPNELLKVRDWSLDDFKKIISPEVLKQIDNFYMCGNYGDPVMNNDLPAMLEYTRSIVDIPFAIHTNGSLRKPEWWADLAKHFTDGGSKVVFAIDGLEDTHHLYRVGTSYNKIIENAKAFIDAGGNAQWAFIKFKHNEHQVEEARQRAIDLGFQAFIHKESIRFHGGSKYEVWDKDGNVTHHLEPSTDTAVKFVPREMFTYDKAKEFVDNTEIKCKVQQTKEVYVDAFGHMYPCCFIAHTPYSPMDPGNPISELKPIVAQQVENAIQKHGGFDAIDLKKRSMKDVINDTGFQTVWKELWKTKQIWICSKTCGVKKDISDWEDQFRNYEFIKSS